MVNQPFKLIAGLGNPGKRYNGTRHNAGAWFVYALAEQYGVSMRPHKKCHGECASIETPQGNCLLYVPGTYMNHSGLALRQCAGFYNIPMTQTLVAHDDLDLPAGTARLKHGGGSGGHNGLKDIQAHLDNHFCRLRLGIGRPPAGEAVIPYVLKVPGQAERTAIDQCIAEVLDYREWLLGGKLHQVMNHLHAT